MNKEFIPYEQAFEIMDLGFDQLCFGSYVRKRSDLSLYFQLGIAIDLTPLDSSSCHAPLYQQAFRWFRENHGLYGIQREWTLDKFSYEIKSNREGSMTFEVYGGYPLIFKTYEEAELACLNRLIEIVKKK